MHKRYHVKKKKKLAYFFDTNIAGGNPIIHYTHYTFIFLLTILKLCLITGSRHAKDFLSEAHVMKYLGNPNVIELYGVCTQIEPFYIVTELATHGSLLDYLKGKILHMY